MEKVLSLQGDALQAQLQTMQGEVTEIKDILWLMEERTRLLKERWKGQANEQWNLLFEQMLEELQIDIGKLQKSVGKVHKVAQCLANAEQKVVALVEAE